MRAKRENRVLNAGEIYDHAVRFLGADWFLRNAAGRDQDFHNWFFRPGIVQSAFASELMLKCLLVIEGKPQSNQHNLKKLFDKLDERHRSEIERRWNADQLARKAHIDELERTHPKGAKIPRDLPTALKKCGNAFVGMRYIYEDPLGFDFYIPFLPYILRDVIRTEKGWTDTLDAFVLSKGPKAA